MSSGQTLGVWVSEELISPGPLTVNWSFLGQPTDVAQSTREDNWCWGGPVNLWSGSDVDWLLPFCIDVRFSCLGTKFPLYDLLTICFVAGKIQGFVMQCMFCVANLCKISTGRLLENVHYNWSAWQLTLVSGKQIHNKGSRNMFTICFCFMVVFWSSQSWLLWTVIIQLACNNASKIN